MENDEVIEENKSLAKRVWGYIKIPVIAALIFFFLYMFGKSKLTDANNLKIHINAGGMIQCQNKNDVVIYNSNEVYLTEQEYIIDKKTKKRITLFDCIQIVKEGGEKL